jgi:pyruvate kinase
MMKKIISQAEGIINYSHEDFNNNTYTPSDLEKKALIKSAIDIADSLNINSIILFTRSGKLAKIAAAYRPRINIFAFTNKKTTVTNTVCYF